MDNNEIPTKVERLANESAELSNVNPRAGVGQSTPGIIGYGGWLQFFCVIWIYVNPPLTLLSWIATLAADSPMPFLIRVLEALVSLGVAFLGVQVGLALRRLEPGAVKLAKLLVIAAFIWNLLIVAALMVVTWDMDYDLAYPLVSLPLSVIALVAWLLYFSKSKRIKLTFLNPETENAGREELK